MQIRIYLSLRFDFMFCTRKTSIRTVVFFPSTSMPIFFHSFGLGQFENLLIISMAQNKRSSSLTWFCPTFSASLIIITIRLGCVIPYSHCHHYCHKELVELVTLYDYSIKYVSNSFRYSKGVLPFYTGIL